MPQVTPVRLNPAHNFQTTKQANTANVESLILEFTPPARTQIILGHEGIDGLPRGQFYPVLKLLEDGGDELPADSELLIAVRADKARSRRDLLSIDYGPFADLTTAEQRNRDKRGTLRQHLPSGPDGRPKSYVINEGNHLEVYLTSSAVLDWDEAVRFELPVGERRG